MDISDVKRHYMEKGELITQKEMLIHRIKQLDTQLEQINKKIIDCLEKENKGK